MSAELDSSRGRVRLSDAEFGVAALLLGDPRSAVLDEPESRGALAALRAAGALQDEELVEWVAELVRVVVAPALRVVVERFIAAETVVSQVWAVPRSAVTGERTDEPGWLLATQEPALLHWWIAQTVGLGPRPQPRVDAPVTTRRKVLDAAVDALAADQPDTALAVLAQAGVREEERTLLLTVMGSRRGTWRASAAWSDEHGRREGSVRVLDAGEEGLWRVIADDEGGPESPVTLAPALPSDVWQAIIDLLPESNPVAVLPRADG